MSAENEKSSLDEIKEYFEGQDRIIDQHGHACAYYDSAQDDSLGFQIVYTVGLSDVDWPELVCAAPLSPDRKASTNLTISILNAFVRALRSTETKPTDGIMLKTTALNVQNGRENVGHTDTNAHPVSRLLLAKKKSNTH